MEKQPGCISIHSHDREPTADCWSQGWRWVEERKDLVWLWGLTTALCLSLPLSSPAFLLVSESGHSRLLRVPSPCTGDAEGALTTQLSTCFPPAPSPGLVRGPHLPLPLRALGGVGQGRDWRGARTSDHGAIRDLLNEALLLQLTDLEVEGSSAARQRQQLPQQQRQGQSGRPRSAPCQPGPGASCPARPRHFPRRAGGPLRPACGDCELAHRLQIPGAPERPRPRRVPANPALRTGHASSQPASEAL